MGGDPVTAEVAELLVGEGVAAADIALEPCGGSGNNRVFVVRAGDRSFVAKCYFTHPGDTRDRLNAEYSFIDCAIRAGIGSVPRAISCNRERNLAVYAYIEGRKISPGELNGSHVEQAAQFLEALNTPDARALAADLPRASESAFSLTEHFDILQRRIDRLKTISPESVTDTAALNFAQALTGAWDRLRARLAGEAAVESEDPDEPLAPAARIISPSDFGFHNALLRPSGEVCFIDFEYAGWDDPAKTVGDFFSQPAVPVPMTYFERIAQAASAFATDPERIIARARRLLPLFQLKWCCIMLNHFLPVSRERRRFANPALDDDEAKQLQLQKAQTFYSTIEI